MRQFIQWVETKIRELLKYVYQCMYSNKEIDDLLALKQNILHAGKNIHLVQRPDGSYDIWVDDPNVFRTVQALPDAEDAEENVIYLVPNPDQSDPENLFLEYIFHKGKPAGEEWELIGGIGVSSAVVTEDSTTVTFSGLGTSSSPLTASVNVPIITYILESGTYPLSPKIDDKVIITSDGTSSGTFIMMYEWNGVEWQIRSLNHNLAYSYKFMVLPNILPQNYISEGNEIKFAYDRSKNDGNQYILLFDQGTIYKLLNYTSTNPDVRIRQLEIADVDYDVTLDGIFTFADEVFTFRTSFNPVDVTITNMFLQTFHFGSTGAKNILLDNINATEDNTILVEGFNTSCTIKNINNVVQVYTVANFNNENIRNFAPTGTVLIELDNLTSEVFNASKDSVLSEINLGVFDSNNAYAVECKLSNLGSIEINFNKCELVGFTLTNFDAKWMEKINFYQTKITQVMMDKVFTDLIAAGLGTSVTGTKTINLSQVEGGIAPSSAIQTQLTTLGYTIKIN